MKTAHYLGMKPGDLDGKPYAKYWNPDMGPVQSQVQLALNQGAEAGELGFPVSEANLLLEAGYLPLENGFTRLQNGQIFVAALTHMPGSHGQMIDWWFGWHYMEHQRYKLWHPRAHLANGAERMIGDEPGLGDREKYLRNPNYVTEYIGSTVMDIVITFHEPAQFLDVSRFAAAGVSTAVCGVVSYRNPPVRFGLLIHLIRETERGCEMRSRFWLGRIGIERLPESGIVNRMISSRLIPRMAVPLQLGRDLLAHCGQEMNHLAGFLPGLYADYHG